MRDIYPVQERKYSRSHIQKRLAFALALAWLLPCLILFRKDLGRRFLEIRVWRNLIHVEDYLVLGATGCDPRCDIICMTVRHEFWSTIWPSLAVCIVVFT